MKQGLNLFIPTQLDKEEAIRAFESEIGIKLPPLYRIFLKNFDLGYQNLLKGKYFVDSNVMKFYNNFGKIVVIENNLITMDSFSSLHDIYGLKRSWTYRIDERYLNKKMLIIGDHNVVANGFLCLGYGDDNYEQIFSTMDEGYEDDPEFPFILGKYGENIFDFVNKLKEMPFPKEELNRLDNDVEPVYCCGWNVDKKPPFM
jgi:SMI1-KNR4 cell-wall